MKNGTIREKKRRISRKPEPVDLEWALRQAERPVDATHKNRHTTRLTPYAEHLLARSAGSHAGNSSATAGAEWITTGAAAKLTGYSQRHIETLCDEGYFVEGKEWRQRRPTPGSDRGGRIFVKHSALRKMEGEPPEI